MNSKISKIEKCKQIKTKYPLHIIISICHPKKSRITWAPRSYRTAKIYKYHYISLSIISSKEFFGRSTVHRLISTPFSFPESFSLTSFSLFHRKCVIFSLLSASDHNKMSGEILSVGEAGKHAGSINTLLYDNDHVYSGGSDGVINVSRESFKTNMHLKSRCIV